ncbi:hypothetical protein PIB30_028243 [Stylosanthes scabra]|uniref:Uncharacterized protein n=1 Tax=Stylosanthes scabra TaxID=79078 RepID=A0ABU6VB16_9FABA|nr:hypothetical protein [Stylosanthes scabra]
MAASDEKEAIEYMAQVREALCPHRKQDYDRLVQILEHHTNNIRAVTESVTEGLKEIFQGHNHLILGFYRFLPPHHQIELLLEQNQEQPPKKVIAGFREAISFFKKVEGRFKDEGRDFNFTKLFLGKSKLWREGKISWTDLYHKIAPHLMEHEDLVEELGFFFPEISEPKQDFPSWATQDDQDQDNNSSKDYYRSRHIPGSLLRRPSSPLLLRPSLSFLHVVNLLCSFVVLCPSRLHPSTVFSDAIRRLCSVRRQLLPSLSVVNGASFGWQSEGIRAGIQ